MNDDLVSVAAQLIAQREPRIVGIAGAPGSGKTTLAHELIDRLAGTASVSLDDFCFSRAERDTRGLRWRAAPGSHDLALLFSTLDAARNGEGSVTLPRYDASIDDRIDPVVLAEPPSLLLIDGWLLGYTPDGYGEILDRIDLLVFLDIALDIAKEGRFERERHLRNAGGGFDEDRMKGFWDEAIAPSLGAVEMSRAAAQVVLELDENRRVRAIRER